MAGEGALPSVGSIPGAVGHGVVRFGGVLVQWGIPLAMVVLGYTLKDPLNLEGIVKAFLPPIAQGKTIIGWPSGMITAILYGGLGFGIWMLLPVVGHIIGGFFIGNALHMLLASIRTERTAPYLPAPGNAAVAAAATGG